MTANDRLFDSLGALNQAWLPAREIVEPLGRQRPNEIGIEDHEVSVVAGADAAARLEIEKVRDFGSKAVDARFEREGAALAHPLTEQVGGQTRITMLCDVSARIGKPDQR